MSRSYKKNPFAGDRKHDKNIANRVVRNRMKRDLDFTIQGNAYKKLYERWEICDYWFFCPFSDYIKSYYNYNKEDGLYYDNLRSYRRREVKSYTKSQIYNEWAKFYKRK
jgi:hypothetical protein